MKIVTRKGIVPPGGAFYYLDPDSGVTLSHPFLEQLQKNAEAHRKANNYPLGANWDEYFEDNACTNTPMAQCHEDSLPQQTVRFVQEIARWANAGFQAVPTEEYERRMSICRGCEFYTGKTGILSIHCKACGCSRLKVFAVTTSCPKRKW